MKLRISHQILQLDQDRRHNDLRQFACWVANQTKPNLAVHRDLVHMISEDVAKGRDAEKTCRLIHDSFSDVAIAAGAVGLRHAPKSASSFLACYACSNAAPGFAAQNAVDWAIRWHLAATESLDSTAFEELILDKLRSIG